jgi:glycolate oxidase FAD binding subunit
VVAECSQGFSIVSDRNTAECIMKPMNENELAQAIKSTDKPLRIVGGGTRQALGNRVDGGVELSTAGLTGITLLEPAALTLVVRAGTPLRDVTAALDAENLQLPFEPMDHRGLLESSGDTTIGGVAACNISGPRRIQAGACRDSMIGVRLVDGAGNIVKNGGRVMKNVTGYDLVKLMGGSMGTLGVISELSFKVQPKPERQATIKIHGLNDVDGVRVLSRALGSPNDVTGAAFLDGTAFVRIEGLPKSVAYRTDALKAVFNEYDVSVTDDDLHTWRGIGKADAIAGGDGSIWRVSVKPTDGPNLVQGLRDAGIAVNAQYDWGGGLVYLSVPDDVNLREYMNGISGHASVLRGNGGGAMRATSQNKLTAQIDKQMRARFDPRGILNTGIMG